MTKKPEILRTETIARTRIFHVERIDLRFSNGQEAQYERLQTSPGGAVLIVPMLDKNTVLLIREYAAGVDRYELVLPKGRIEPDESVLDAANRELMEEVGYAAKNLRHIKSLTLAPGYANHTTHIVLAQDLFAQKLAGDEPETIEVLPWPLKKITELLDRDDCTEARSIAALYMVRDQLASAT